MNLQVFFCIFYKTAKNIISRARYLLYLYLFCNFFGHSNGRGTAKLCIVTKISSVICMNDDLHLIDFKCFFVL